MNRVVSWYSRTYIRWAAQHEPYSLLIWPATGVASAVAWWLLFGIGLFYWIVFIPFLAASILGARAVVKGGRWRRGRPTF
jgi:hypothetical protein